MSRVYCEPSKIGDRPNSLPPKNWPQRIGRKVLASTLFAGEQDGKLATQKPLRAPYFP
jgi:hypothetical protein